LEEISLETMDGYQFQKLIANLFEKLGFVNIKVGPPAADGGIDVSMEQKTAVGSIKFTVECKHHPASTIGRPVVQKLHSAVIHSPFLNKGIIVTSGHFSGEAIQYAEEVGIELIDMDKLKELAKKVGISLHTKSSLSIENCFPTSGKTKVIEKLLNFLEDDLYGFNKDFLQIEKTGLRLVPIFLIDYFINATFSTSVGIIHSVRGNSSVLLAGDTGELIHPIIMDHLLPFRNNISKLNEEDIKGIMLLEKREFVKSYKEIREIAKQGLRRFLTKTVSYYGANNRRYTKTCVPNARDITLLDIKGVYFPAWEITFALLKNRYFIVGVENPNDLCILPSSFFKTQELSEAKVYPDCCMICSRDMKGDKSVCGECGIIVCNKDISECRKCGKMICRTHTVSKRKFLILSDKYCFQCAKSEGMTSL